MPLPLLLGAAAAFLGAGNLAGAYVDNDNAKKIAAEADDLVRYGEYLMEEAQEAARKSLTSLGKKKAHVLNTSIKNFVALFSQLHNIDFNTPSDTGELSKFQLDQPSLDSLRELSTVSLALTNASAGALIAFGAYGAASLLGVSSAGAAVTALTGLAANSTLAFISGGTIAAGVTSVLGGLVTAPALAVLGIFLSSSAARNLEDARSNKSQALRFVKEMEAGVSLCNGIRKMSYLYVRMLMRLEPMMNNANNNLRNVINSYGTDYRTFSNDEKKTVAAAASLAKAVKTIIDTPILTQDGKLTTESLEAANTVRAALPA